MVRIEGATFPGGSTRMSLWRGLALALGGSSGGAEVFLPVMGSFELQHGPLGHDVLRAQEDQGAAAALDVPNDLLSDLLANLKVAHMDAATGERWVRDKCF